MLPPCGASNIQFQEIRNKTTGSNGLPGELTVLGLGGDLILARTLHLPHCVRDWDPEHVLSGAIVSQNPMAGEKQLQRGRCLLFFPENEA